MTFGRPPSNKPMQRTGLRPAADRKGARPQDLHSYKRLCSMTATRLLMSASALVLGLLGLVCSFAPEYLLRALSAPLSPVLVLMVQVLGALYLGFAGLNWMARENLIGGIYSRPVAIGNLMHFLVAGLALIKAVMGSSELALYWPVALLYIGFATAFGLIIFRHPIRAQSGRAG
jgi:hypothetical protein